MTSLLIELLQEDLEGRTDGPDRGIDGHAVTRIAHRIFADSKTDLMPDHTIVIGGTPARRRRVLETVAAGLKSGGANAAAYMDGRKLASTGAEAIWRMAASELGLKESGEDIDPLSRLVDACPPRRRIAVLIDRLDELIVKWGKKDEGNPDGRDSIWNLRHTMQNVPLIVLAGSAGTWPPKGTTSVDSGAYGSFSVIDLGK